ncbi:hypothetical protein ON010_g15524 [Phytophthora cinnamomi]|nr:hypothetical protein ON010_g15524 [Phytophthora cinnamomi]
MAADSAPVVNEVTERLVVRLQTLYRARRARREAVELANSAYLKCWDAVSGLAYYCNLRTGLSSWKKPLLLAARDPIANPADDGAKIPEITFEATNDPIPDPVAQLSSKDRQKRHEEGLAFKEKCAQEKRELMLRHRRKIARAMRRFEKNMLDEKTRNRQERQARLKNDNQQLLQDLYHGNKVRKISIARQLGPDRKAAGHGLQRRRREFIAFVACLKAMGLTPLLAACQSGHLEVVRRLLSSGASVNHAHIKTGRTALMEAASCAKPPVLKELLRYGNFVAARCARIYAEDVQGETVFDCMKDAANREVIARACQVWSIENASLFPTEFRRVSLAYALISKRQRDAYEAEKVATRRDLTQLKQVLQRKCVDTKIRYDQDVRGSSFEPTLLRRLSSLETADLKYDAERRVLLLEIQDAVDKLRESERPRFIPEVVILNILSFCSRHWFDADPAQPQVVKKKKTSKKKKIARTKSKFLMALNVPPTALRPPPDQLPEELEEQFTSFQQSIKVNHSILVFTKPDLTNLWSTKELCDQLQAATGSEHFDTANGISRDSSGASLATLDIFVEQAENLPYRDPRICDMVN